MKINVQIQDTHSKRGYSCYLLLTCLDTNIHLTVYLWEILYDFKEEIVT